MNQLDYYQNPEITSYIKSETSGIINPCDKEDCEQEIWAELYDFMPLDVSEAKRLINKVAKKMKRGIKNLAENEIGFSE